MTDLHWALLGLGALIIGAVLAFNWWQERKFRQTFKRLDEPEYDALMEDARAVRNEEFHIDHSMVRDIDDAPVKEIKEQFQAEQRHTQPMDEYQYEAQDELEALVVPMEPEPSVADYAPATAEELPPWEEEPLAQPEPEPELAHQPASPSVITIPPEVNPEIDLVAVISLTTPASGQALREFLLSITDIDKPVYAYGLGDDQRWHLLTREQETAHFHAAVCSVQLADRAGAVSTGTLSRFHLAVEELAQALDASLEWLNVDNALQQARDLDQFCIEVDQLVRFHLMQGNGSFTGTKFRGLAEAGGLSLGEDGAYHYLAEDSEGNPHVLFSVVNHGNQPFSVDMLRTSVIRGLTFQLDIPRVQSYIESYNHMVMLARQMEHGLGAHLVDDKQHALNDVQIDKIRQQIKLIHDKMIARGIMPGQAYALRLFS